MTGPAPTALDTPDDPTTALRARLEAIRRTRQGGAAPSGTSPTPAGGDLATRLAQLRVQRHTAIRSSAVPRYDRFGEPASPQSQDLEAAGGGFEPGITSPTTGRTLPIRTARTAGLGIALGAGELGLGTVKLGLDALKAVFAPASGAELRSPLLRATLGNYGPPGATQDLDARAAETAPQPSEQTEFLKGLNPLPMVAAALRGDPKAVGQILAMPLLGRAFRGAPGTDLARGAEVRPGAAQAFETLGLDPKTATVEDVEAAAREAAMRTHPDVPADVRAARGGPTDPLEAQLAFIRSQAAKQAALEALGEKPVVQERQPAPAPATGGRPAEPTAASPTAAEAGVTGPAQAEPVPPPAGAALEALQQDMEAGKYSVRDLKGLRAKVMASALASSARPVPPETLRVIDAIDTHLAKQGVAGAAPLEPEPAPAPAAAPGAALHDVEGQPVAGSTVTPAAEAARAERRTAAPREHPVDIERRRGVTAPPAKAGTAQVYSDPAGAGAGQLRDLAGATVMPKVNEHGMQVVNFPGGAYGYVRAAAKATPQVPAEPGQKYVVPSFATAGAARGEGVEATPDRQANVDRLIKAWEPKLRAAIAKDPAPYGNPTENQIVGTLNRFRKTLVEKGVAGVNVSASMKAAARALGIPPTQKGLEAFLTGPATMGLHTITANLREGTVRHETSRVPIAPEAAGRTVGKPGAKAPVEPSGRGVEAPPSPAPALPAAPTFGDLPDGARFKFLSGGGQTEYVKEGRFYRPVGGGKRLTGYDASAVAVSGSAPSTEAAKPAPGHPSVPIGTPTSPSVPIGGAPTVQRTLEEANKPAPAEDLEKLADAAKRLLDYEHTPTGAPFPRDPKAVRAWAEKVLGRPYSSGTWTTDDAYDAIEVAANRYWHDLVGPMKWVSARDITDRLKAAKQVEEKILGTRTRTEAMVARQQFSTPLPIAEAAAYAADVLPHEKVLEPTAGTGNLINSLRGTGAVIDANELDPRRAALLRVLDPALHVTSEDALALFLSGKRYNAIVMNPPFGGYNLHKYAGQGTTPFAASDVSQRFVAAALRSLADNGRLVAIMPEGMMGKTASAFRAWLRANYQVTALIEAPPGSYATRGTTFGTWMLVVDNTGPHLGNTLEIHAPSWEVWEGAVSLLGRPERRSRPMQGGHEPAADVPAARQPSTKPAAPLAPAPLTTASSPVAEAAQEMAAAVKQAVKDAVEEVRREREPAAPAEPPAGAEPTRAVAGGAGEGPVAGVGGERGPGPGGPAPEPRRGAPAEPPGGGGVVAPEGPARPVAPEPGPAQGVVPRLARRRVEPGRLDSPERRAELQAANDSPVFTPYERGTALERNPHPRLVVETRSQAGMPAPAPHITEFQSPLVQAAWGRPGAKGGLSDDQADMAMRVLSAWDRGHGFVIADDVGVGKSREAAALILEAIARGEQRILYSTKNETNLVDVQKELRLVATGSDEGDFPATFVLGQDYPKAATRSGRVRTEGLPTPAGPTVYLVHSYNFEPLGESLLEVKPTVWVGDEAHEYKNGYSKRGMAWQRLHGQMLEQGGKFVYLTATPAVTLDELGYLYGLREWPVGGFPDWVARRLGKADESSHDAQSAEAIEVQRAADTAVGERAGIQSTDLAAGKKRPFMRENIDAFAGRISPAETEQVMRELKGMGKFLARDLWRGGVEFTVHTLDLLGDGAEAVAARTRYNAAADLVRDITQTARKFGYLNQETKTTGLERAMIQSYMKQLLFDLRLPEILRLADQSLAAGRQVVLSVHTVSGDADVEEGLTEDDAQIPLNKRLESAIARINTREVKKQGTGDQVEFVDLGEIPEALAKRAELLDKLKDLPPLKDPVRAFEDHFGAKNLAVITGQVSPQNRTKQMGEFQAGKRKVAMISKAGKVGISLHDVNGKQRHLIVGDYEWSADLFKQELGRVDRTGQRSKPLITLVASNVGGERKFAATIAARMSTLGATSKGAAEATGTDALDQFEAVGDLPVAAMKNAVEKMPDDLRRYFTGSKFVEAKEGYRGERVFKAKRRPEDADMRAFLLEMLMFPVEAANRALELWTAEREKLMTGEATAAAEARKTGKLTGHVVRVTELTHAPQPTLTMYEVQNDAGEQRAILQGFVTQHIDNIQNARGRDDSGYQRPRRYVSFTDTKSGELIAGLEVAPAEARRIKTAFGAGETRFLTPADAFGDLQAGDAVKVQGAENAEWTLHPRRDGRIAIRGATVAKHRDVLRDYARYEPVGNYLYVKDGDTLEGVTRFLERFPVKQATVANPKVPPAPGAARYERLGQIFQSPLGLKAREFIRDRLVEGGHDPAEVEALDDRGLANRALEHDVLTPEEQTKLLDGLWGEAGFARLSKRGKARAAAPPELPAKSLLDAVRKLTNPAGRTTGSQEMAHVVRARTGEQARRSEIDQAALAPFRRLVKQLSSAARFEFIDNVETGRGQSAPGLQPLADALRTALDEARLRVQALGTGKLEHFIQDYFPHIWEDADAARSVIARILGKRPLQGPKSFLKKRTIPTTAEGVEAGLKPVTDNPIDLVLLKLREMNRYVMGQRILQDARAQGLVKFVKATARAPVGYLPIDDAIATVYGPLTEEGAQTIRGRYTAPEPIATVLNNHLRPGLRGNALFDAYSFVGNALNQVQLGLSLFHLGFVSMDAIISQQALGFEQIASGVRHGQLGRVAAGVGNVATQWVAPFSTFVRGNKVIQEYTRPGSVGGEFVAIADAVTQGGGRVKMDQLYKNNAVAKFLEAARKGQMVRTAGWLVPAAMELAARPLMEVIVPRMKLGVFADLVRFELARLPPDATVEQVRAVMATAWDSVDNRMGQVVYDNLFWSRTQKDLGMASVRSLGWNLGTLREVGGGAADLGRGRWNHRTAYVLSLPIAVGLLGALLMYLWTGRGPESLQDYFQPRTGRTDGDGNDERVQLPSYMKDVLAFTTHGVHGAVATVGHKLHPLLSYLADMLTNQDYWGGEIRNEHDPLVDQVRQVADYTATQFTPIGYRNVQEQRRRLQTGGRAALPFIGVTPASRADVRSPAQNLMADFLKQGTPSGATPEEAAVRRARNDVMDRFHQRTLDYGEARAELRAKGLTAQQTADALRRMLGNPLVERFKQLTLAQAQQVYDLATPHEKDLWGPALFRKISLAHPRNPPRAPRAPHR